LIEGVTDPTLKALLASSVKNSRKDFSAGASFVGESDPQYNLPLSASSVAKLLNEQKYQEACCLAMQDFNGKTAFI